jgi:prepilin peptidase CpaA
MRQPAPEERPHSSKKTSQLASRLARGGASSGLAVLFALVVGALFLWTGAREPLPALGWSAGFLFFVVEEDVRRRRIPNWLTIPALGVALGLGGWAGGWLGAATAVGGAALAFGLLFPVFCMRWMGAGDVKALMVLGALWGPMALLGSLWWMMLAGGVTALAVAATSGALPDLLRRWALSLAMARANGRWLPLPPASGGAARTGIPFGLAIGLGAAAYQYWGVPWL